MGKPDKTAANIRLVILLVVLLAGLCYVIANPGTVAGSWKLQLIVDGIVAPGVFIIWWLLTFPLARASKAWLPRLVAKIPITLVYLFMGLWLLLIIALALESGPGWLLLLIPLGIQLLYILGAEPLLRARLMFFPSQRESVANLYEFIACALRSGVPLEQALELREPEVRPLWLRRRVKFILQNMHRGEPFSKAAGEYMVVFPPEDRAIIEAGETGGKLPEAFEYVARNQRVFRARTVPVGLLAVEILLLVQVVTFCLIFIVPKFKDIFDQIGSELPFSTQLLIDISWRIAHYWVWGFLALLVLWFLNTRGMLTRAMLKVAPASRSLYWAMPWSRFSYALSDLLSGGCSLVDAVPVAIAASGSKLMKRAAPAITQRLESGVPIEDAICKLPCLPRKYRWFFDASFRTEKPETGLRTLAEHCRSEHHAQVFALSAVLLPILVALMAAAALFVLLAFYQPLFNIPFTLRQE